MNQRINKHFEVIYLEKKTLRREILSKRSALGNEVKISLSRKIFNTLKNTEYYKKAENIFVFISFGSEIDTHEFIKEGIKEGKNILVPVTIHETREMKPSLIKDFDELEIGYFNILSPKEEYIRYVDPQNIDLVVVPGAVFDRRGYRVGYGGGFYDRFLSTKIRKDVPKIAVGFDLQVIDMVPTEEFDFPVDFIITEKELIDCK
ncbi:5-formyltetrahydrofolate cyclo-ligase [Tissierella creatinini]|nr:5-formyltetrahydrofolate cyclo-ligase [Tissierella creatinini]TJX67400.1 5-formyltetrahydrofolate cyclo-ligase [Soehngenia saccharolytica]